MENGSFQFLQLADLDFAESPRASLPRQAEPAPAKVQIDLKNIPKDLMKSNTIEALVSQNEDLAARQKVTLQRLAKIEDRNKQIEEEGQELRQSHSIISDQMMIWKEKEKVWKQRHDGLDQELQIFRERFPDYLKMEDTVERYKRYHERVKSQIKPYIRELKGYAQALHSQILELHAELDRKDNEVKLIQRKNQETREQSDNQAQSFERSQNQLITEFERRREQLEHENTSLKEANTLNEVRSYQLDQALERQDELENLVIALRRAKEEYQQQIHSEIVELRNQNGDYRRLITERELVTEDLKGETHRLRDTLSGVESKKADLEEQLASLRFLWSNKSEESEKLRLQIASLERINLDLSSKLNESRRIQATF